MCRWRLVVPAVSHSAVVRLAQPWGVGDETRTQDFIFVNAPELRGANDTHTLTHEPTQTQTHTHTALYDSPPFLVRPQACLNARPRLSDERVQISFYPSYI